MTVPAQEISQKILNSVLLNLRQIFTIKNALTVEDSTNDFCILSFEFDEHNKNFQTGNEFIIFNQFNVTLSDTCFSIFDYYLLLKYYRLDSDMDENDAQILLEKEVSLSLGDNTISFEEYPVYLQSEFDLLIKKGES